MSFLDFLTTGQADGDSNGSLFTRLRDVAGNGIGKKHRSSIIDSSEAIPVGVKNDDNLLFMRGDRKGNVIMGNYTPELQENFEGATINVNKWAPANTTFVPAQTTLNGYVFNSTNLTTAAAVAILQSLRLFSKVPRTPLQLKQRVRANIFTNSFADFGFGVPATVTQIVPNGACIRIVNGNWFAVITYNSAEIAIANIVGADGVTQLNTANTNAEFYTCDIIIDDDNLIATVQNTQTGDLVGTANVAVPLSAAKMFGATALPIYSRVVNVSAPATAPNFVVTELQVLTTDWNANPDMSQLAGSLGLSAGRNPFTGAQLENHTNSTGPTSATLSNTAAGYTTLGGKYQFAAIGGAATDYALFAFQVPAGSRFLCEGISISARNRGAIVAVTETELEWSLGFNSSAVSLATANIIRRQVPGAQIFPIGSAIGATVPTIDMNLVTPEVVESGRFIHVILAMPVATATASQVIRGQVTIKGRFI